MPCPHYDIRIVQWSGNQSAVAAAAYQSGEKLFSEYDQKQKYYSHKNEIVHKEIILPIHAPPKYADRNILWNAAEAVEKQWNSHRNSRLNYSGTTVRSSLFLTQVSPTHRLCLYGIEAEDLLDDVKLCII